MDSYIEDYLAWLREMVRLDEPQYDELAQVLWSTDFHYSVRGDDNRAADGVALRKEYDETYGHNCTKLASKPCSVLEFLIALAKRMDYATFDYTVGPRVYKWFWDMLRNLGIGEYRCKKPKIRGISTVLENFMTRNYDENGTGNIFSLRKTVPEFEKIEFWYQMNAYLDENWTKL